MSIAPKTARSAAGHAEEAGKEATETFRSATQSATEEAKSGAETMTRAATETVGQTVSAASQGAGKAMSTAREAFEGALNAGGTFDGYEDLVQFNKDNFEALVQSSTIAVRGVQDISKMLIALAQENIEVSVSAGQSLIGIKTLQEFIDVSSNLARSNFDKMVSESARLSQLSTKVAEEAFAPLNSRVDATFQKLGRAQQTLQNQQRPRL